jgi:hypothetical protein
MGLGWKVVIMAGPDALPATPKEVPPSPGSAGPATWRLALNLAALAALLVANYVWLVRYTSLFDESIAFYALNGGLLAAAIAWAVGSLTKWVKKDRFEAAQGAVTEFLSTHSVVKYLAAAFVVEWLVSLCFGGLELRDPVGADGKLKVKIHRTSAAEPAEPPAWDTKQVHHSGPWGMWPWNSVSLEVAVQGTPRRTTQLRPWWGAGGTDRLEYPKDFLRPVVFITTEKQLVRYAAKAPDKYRLTVWVGAQSYGPLPYDGHSVWVGCRQSDALALPAGARFDWDNETDQLLVERVLQPQEHPGLTEPLRPGVTVSAKVEQSDGARRTRPEAVTALRPSATDRQVQVLFLKLNPP